MLKFWRSVEDKEEAVADGCLNKLWLRRRLLNSYSCLLLSWSYICNFCLGRVLIIQRILHRQFARAFVPFKIFVVYAHNRFCPVLSNSGNVYSITQYLEQWRLNVVDENCWCKIHLALPNHPIPPVSRSTIKTSNSLSYVLRNPINTLLFSITHLQSTRRFPAPTEIHDNPRDFIPAPETSRRVSCRQIQ